jgi:hypothetical protein
MQLTVCAAMAHAHPVPVALVGVTPVGNVSLMVTAAFVAPYGLTFETGIV